MSDTHARCPDEAVLEQLAMGRLEGPALTEMESHVASCASCTTALEALKVECTSIESALRIGRGALEVGCLSDEQLALYLDAGLDEDARTAVEEHLGMCSACQERVVEVYRDVVRLRDGGESDELDPAVEAAEPSCGAEPDSTAKLTLHPQTERPSQSPGLGRLKATLSWAIALTIATGIASFIAGEIGPGRLLYTTAVWSIVLGHVWLSRRIGPPRRRIGGRRAPTAWLTVSLLTQLLSGAAPGYATLCAVLGIMSGVFGLLGYFASDILSEGTKSENWGYSTEEPFSVDESQKSREARR
jgi:hypothetical protein